MPELKVKMPVGGDEPTIIKHKDGGDDGGGDNSSLTAEQIAAQKADTDNQDPNVDTPEGNTSKDDSADDNSPISIEGLDEVDIDGVIHYISPEGNIVNDKGEQAYSKEEFDTMRVNSSDIDIELISRHSGIELKDGEGNPITFPNTVEGIAKREAYIQEQAYKKAQRDTLSEFFTKYPAIKDVFEHYSQKGTISDYKPATDYSKISLSKDNVGQLEQIIIDAEVKAGKSPEMARKLVEFYTANNELYEGAVSAKDYLAKQQQSERAAKEQAAIDKQNQERQKYIEIIGYDIDKNGKEIVLNVEGSIYDKVMNKGQIGEFKIPETGIHVKQDDGTIKVFKRKDILNYITLAANEEGQSQAEIDEIKHYSKLDNRLLRYLHNLTQGDMSKLVPQAKATAEAKRIRRVSAKGIETKGGQQGNTNKRNAIKLKTPVE